MVKHGEPGKLIGEYVGKLVAGNRVVLPSLLRKLLGTSFVVTKGYEGCLLVVPSSAWQKLIQPIEGRSFLDRNSRDSLRFLAGSAFEVPADVQGRIVLPETLREYGNMVFSEKKDTEIVFVGLLSWIEVWEKSRWQARAEFLEKNADSIAQELISLKKEE